MFTLQPLNPSNRALSMLTIANDGLALTIPPALAYKLAYSEPLPPSATTPPLACTLTPSSSSDTLIYRLEGGLTAPVLTHWLDDLTSMNPRSASVDLDTIIHLRLSPAWSPSVFNHSHRTPFLAEVPNVDTPSYHPLYELTRHAVLPQGTVLTTYHLEILEPKTVIAALNREGASPNATGTRSKARDMTIYLCHRGIISPWLMRDLRARHPSLAEQLLHTPAVLTSEEYLSHLRPLLPEPLVELVEEAAVQPQVTKLVNYWLPMLSKHLPPSKNLPVAFAPLHLACTPRNPDDEKKAKVHPGRKPASSSWYQENGAHKDELLIPGAGKDASRFGGIWPLLFIGRHELPLAIESYWGGYVPVMKKNQLVDVTYAGPVLSNGGESPDITSFTSVDNFVSPDRTVALINTLQKGRAALVASSDRVNLSPSMAALSASSDTISARAKDLLLETLAKAGITTILDADELNHFPHSAWAHSPEERRKRLVRVLSPSMRGAWVIGFCRRCGGRVAGPWQTIAQGRYKSCGCGWSSSHGRKGT